MGPHRQGPRVELAVGPRHRALTGHVPRRESQPVPYIKALHAALHRLVREREIEIRVPRRRAQHLRSSTLRLQTAMYLAETRRLHRPIRGRLTCLGLPVPTGQKLVKALLGEVLKIVQCPKSLLELGTRILLAPSVLAQPPPRRRDLFRRGPLFARGGGVGIGGLRHWNVRQRSTRVSLHSMGQAKTLLAKRRRFNDLVNRCTGKRGSHSQLL